jgi:hypothetical protein
MNVSRSASTVHGNCSRKGSFKATCALRQHEVRNAGVTRAKRVKVALTAYTCPFCTP